MSDPRPLAIVRVRFDFRFLRSESIATNERYNAYHEYERIGRYESQPTRRHKSSLQAFFLLTCASILLFDNIYFLRSGLISQLN